MGFNDENMLFGNEEEAKDDEQSEIDGMIELHEEHLARVQEDLQRLEEQLGQFETYLKYKLEIQRQNAADIKLKVELNASNFKLKGDEEKPLSLLNPKHGALARVKGREISWYKFLEELIRMCLPDLKGSPIFFGQTVCDFVINPILEGKEIDFNAFNKRVKERKNKTAKANIKRIKKLISERKKQSGDIQKEMRSALFQKESGLDGIQTRFEHSKSVPAKEKQNKRDRMKRKASSAKKKK